MSGEPLARFEAALPITIRRCEPDDLPKLEWFGMFAMHREIIRDAFARQERGENLMLVADANGFPVGQVWTDFARHAAEHAAFIWAMRVLPLVQCCGIGAQLMRAAETAAQSRGCVTLQLGVEKTNVSARRFYERNGYELFDELREQYSFRPPDSPNEQSVALDEWLMRKLVA